jgi:predicted nucleic acid-binding protein
MRTAIDTNVISALWSGEPASQGMAALLGSAKNRGGLVICAPVYVELLAYPRATRTLLEQFLATTQIVTDFLLDEAVWQEAGAAYAAYAQRRRQSKDGSSKRLLVDFIVGAHAILKADRLLTLDAARYQVAFPKLVMVP